MNYKINKLNKDKIKALKSVCEDEFTHFYVRLPHKHMRMLKRYLVTHEITQKDWLIKSIEAL
jgi:hypothetical protein